MTSSNSSQTIVLIAGHWLGSWAWDEVLEHLAAGPHRPTALTLPGLDPRDPDRATRTLDDQTAAILDHIATLGGSRDNPVTLVGHSGANAPVSMVIDQHPELIRSVIWVDSGPVTPGRVFAPSLPEGLTELPLPSFDLLAKQASLTGLTPEMLDRFRAQAVPQPGPTLHQAVALTNDLRYSIPTTLVCSSISGTQVLELARSGHPMFAEVAKLDHSTVVDLPTGHWPMWSRAGDLADTIESAATRG